LVYLVYLVDHMISYEKRSLRVLHVVPGTWYLHGKHQNKELDVVCEGNYRISDRRACCN
jgi:hypothetical protein